MNAASHTPVMLAEMLQALAPRDGETYVDGTFGAGGYSRAILKQARCKVYAIDRDETARQFAGQLEREFPGRFAFLVGSFGEMCALLAREGVEKVDGIVLDIGISSMQIDQAERGFSFRSDGPLDMRMARNGISAAEWVNSADEVELADVIYTYGEEHASRRIAKAIIKARAEKPIERTLELAEIIRGVVGKTGKADPATRSFQAIRIHINDELGELTRGLQAAEVLLAPQGRLVVVTFHSLEDRLVKHFTHSRCGKLGGASRHLPTVERPGAEGVAPPIFLLPRPHKRGVSDAEARANPRARSATLRTAIRTAAPPGKGEA